MKKPLGLFPENEKAGIIHGLPVEYHEAKEASSHFSQFFCPVTPKKLENWGQSHRRWAGDRRGTLVRFLVVVFFLSFLPAGKVLAESLFISNIEVAPQVGSLLFSARLNGNMPGEIEEMINGGTETTFIYHIEINRERSFWIDSVVSRYKIKRSVKFDVLKKNYNLLQKIEKEPPLEKEGVPAHPPRATTKFEDVKTWMTQLSGVPLIGSGDLQEGEKYYLRVRADLKTTELPLPLNYLLFFLSFWDVDTDWEHSSPFAK